MMGSPYYYDVHFDPSALDVVFHDCMWSGTCCIQLIQQQQQPPNTSGASLQPQSQYHLQLHNQQQQQQLEQLDKLMSTSSQDEQEQQPTGESKLEPPTTATPATSVVQPLRRQQAQNKQQFNYHHHRPIHSHAQRQYSHHRPHHRVRLLHPRKVPTKLHHHNSQQQQQQQQQQQTRRYAQQIQQPRQQQLVQLNQQAISARAAVAEPFASIVGGRSMTTATSAADSKKLRHREVEKNRHRQLQAMVKTLSDRIPGRIEKETQVHTMKRAARYCQYLLDVLTHGQQQQQQQKTPAIMSKDELERLYLRSCESVDLMMSQSSSEPLNNINH